jgi:hypothetical protein
MNLLLDLPIFFPAPSSHGNFIQTGSKTGMTFPGGKYSRCHPFAGYIDQFYGGEWRKVCMQFFLLSLVCTSLILHHEEAPAMLCYAGLSSHFTQRIHLHAR